MSEHRVHAARREDLGEMVFGERCSGELFRREWLKGRDLETSTLLLCYLYFSEHKKFIAHEVLRITLSEQKDI